MSYVFIYVDDCITEKYGNLVLITKHTYTHTYLPFFLLLIACKEFLEFGIFIQVFFGCLFDFSPLFFCHQNMYI